MNTDNEVLKNNSIEKSLKATKPQNVNADIMPLVLSRT